MDRLATAFQSFPFQPVALSQLANHCFFSGQLSAVERLASALLACTEVPALRADAYFQLARCFHASVGVVTTLWVDIAMHSAVGTITHDSGWLQTSPVTSRLLLPYKWDQIH